MALDVNLSKEALFTTDFTLQEIVQRIMAAGRPDKIVLFGSRANGQSRESSDYDLLVIEPSDLPRHKRAVKYRRALIGLGVAKDIVVWTPEEIAEWRQVPNAFITTIIREGMVLYERVA